MFDRTKVGVTRLRSVGREEKNGRFRPTGASLAKSGMDQGTT